MKNDNDKKIAEYRKNNIIKWGVVFLYICVILLEILALFNIINMLWGFALFVVVIILKKIFLK